MLKAPTRLRGEARLLATPAAASTAVAAPATAPAEIAFDADSFTISLDDGTPIRAAYRDLSTVDVQEASALLAIGEGEAALRLILERFGDRLGLAVRELRERRLRQRLADRLVDLGEENLELVEYIAGDERGVAQLAIHPWGAVLAPIDERRAWRSWRRSQISDLHADVASGTLTIAPPPGSRDPVELPALGAALERHRRQWQALRDGAASDASAIIGTLVPDAPFDVRRHAASLLVDGRPVRRAQLREAWTPVEAAVLAEPTFAASYRELVARSATALVWLAIAPERPGAADPWRAWFFVALPGNLVAMELVSAGAHATYCFRATPRADYRGQEPAAMLAEATAAVHEISEALVDARYLREPMALPAAQLADPRHARYRLALRELSSLAAARSRFVARLVHREHEGWAAALDALIAWHQTERDDAADWPGRVDQEAAVTAAAERAPSAAEAAEER